MQYPRRLRPAGLRMQSTLATRPFAMRGNLACVGPPFMAADYIADFLESFFARPDGKVAYVSCSGSHQVAAIDLPQWKVEPFIEAGDGADGLAWAGK